MVIQLRYMVVGGGVELLMMIILECSSCRLRLAGYLGMWVAWGGYLPVKGI